LAITVRRSAQRQGTKGAKRLLKRLSRRERKPAAPINHVLSRRIVDKARATHRAIAIEDLTGIRERTRVRKDQRYAHPSWSFHQLRSLLAYKAIDAGVPLVALDPRSTSKTCHRCGERGHRDALIFSCTTCGEFDADINAALTLNISARRAEVTRPEIAAGAGCLSGNAPLQ
jgi:IS605 OrfB family transposase